MIQRELILHQVYKTAATVEKGIDLSISFIFKTSKPKLKLLQNKCKTFHKNTLLHEYIKACFLFDNDNYFYETPDDVIDGVFDLDFLEDQFASYAIEIDFLRIKWPEDQDYPTTSTKTVFRWYNKNRTKFIQLAEKISDDIFFILFSNRNLLSNFNRMISNDFKNIKFAKKDLTQRGKIKRVNIPDWVKTAVFFRDKGHCTICKINLTGTISILDKENYDHIVPLDLFGINDPTNIQLLCKKCNKEKLNRNTESGLNYEYWFD
jgi:hypothetical protein